MGRWQCESIQCPYWWTCVDSSGTMETKARRWAGWAVVKNCHQRRTHMLIYSPMRAHLQILFWQSPSQMHSTRLIKHFLCAGECAESGVAEMNSWHGLFSHGAFYLLGETGTNSINMYEMSVTGKAYGQGIRRHSACPRRRRESFLICLGGDWVQDQWWTTIYEYSFLIYMRGKPGILQPTFPSQKS